MKVVAYVRVSTEDQGQGYSLEAQEKAIKELCSRKNWDFVKTYSDSGFSGSNLERPGITELIDDSSKGLFDLVLVTNNDRLSRDPADFWPLVRTLLKNKVEFCTTMIPEITSRFKEFYVIYGPLVGFSKYFLMDQRDKSNSGIKVAKEKGKHLGRVPLGYDMVTRSDGPNDPNRNVLVLNDLGKQMIDLLTHSPELSVRQLSKELEIPERAAYNLRNSIRKHAGI